MNSQPFYYHLGLGGYIGLDPQIVNWKPVNTPQGVMPGSIRPLSNKDYTNTTIYKHGATRPLHTVWRQGNNIANQSFVNSSIAHTGIRHTIDDPGFFVTTATSTSSNTDSQSQELPSSSNDGLPLCVSFMIPNYDLTNNPEPASCTPTFCCNQERKARRMSLAANTVKKDNYFTNTSQYLYKRNKTYSQNSFHILIPPTQNTTPPNGVGNLQNNYKPGGPISTLDNYTFNTNSHCILGVKDGQVCTKKTIYHPNNYTFAKQGSVTDRTRNLNLVINALASSNHSYRPYRNAF